jgi:hypothetical protein
MPAPPSSRTGPAIGHLVQQAGDPAGGQLGLADEQTLHGLGVTGRVPPESTFRRTLQRLDPDASDDLAGGWAAQRTAPGPKERARAACAFVGGLLGTGHPCGDTAVLLAAVWQKCPVQRLGRSRETVTVAIRAGDGVVQVED